LSPSTQTPSFWHGFEAQSLALNWHWSPVKPGIPQLQTSLWIYDVFGITVIGMSSVPDVHVTSIIGFVRFWILWILKL